MQLISVVSGTGADQITAANGSGDIRIRIPGDFPMMWDTLVTTATIGGPASSNVSTTVIYEDAGLTLVIDVTTDFAGQDTITVDSLFFSDFPSNYGIDNLELEIDNDNVVSTSDPQTIRINEPPILSSASNQTFSIGNPSTPSATPSASERQNPPDRPQ